MSHPEQLAFFHLCADANNDLISRSRVLEIGSFDVNGSIRALFGKAEEYCGVDLVEGPGVDRISFGHDIDDPDGSWDFTLSAECFEHDPHWRDTLTNMVRMTRPGGLVVVTCASAGRVEHGTRRTAADDSPGTQFEGIDYYRNVSEAELRRLPLGSWFSDVLVAYNRTSCDLYLVGIRAGEPAPGSQGAAAIPARHAVDGLSRMMPAHLRAVRMPLRALRAVVTDEDRYQDLAVPYWLATVRVMSAVEGGLKGLARRRRAQSTT